MAERVRDVLTHEAGRTAVSTVIGYLLILGIMTLVLFGGALVLFRVFG